ncbi:MAG: hypothetical protein Fur0018_11020 [Anaerolineales bacterium]
MDLHSRYTSASIKTAENLKTIATAPGLRSISRLSLPEVEAVTDLISRIVPAGNVPGVILSGLARLSGHRVPPQVARRDIDLLFKGVEQTLDHAVYAAFFAGPAAILWGYQNLLKLAGKPPEAAFPEGTWQFYIEYALREDTARHTNETHGFASAMVQHQLRLSPADRLTAWTMAAIHTLYHYPALLANEWNERMSIALLQAATQGSPHAARYAGLYRAWQRQIPYRREADAENQNYPAYRQARFKQFLQAATTDLPGSLRQAWQVALGEARTASLPAYQRQMSILAYLQPDTYGETRTPLRFDQAYVGVIFQGRYALVRAADLKHGLPANAHQVRAQIQALIYRKPQAAPANLTALARTRRAALADLRPRLPERMGHELNLLRSAPILINADLTDASQPLTRLRQSERGVGDHPLTIFLTPQTAVFDQSHIFFDGAWGAALAEILTNEALSWAVYLSEQEPPTSAAPPQLLTLERPPAVQMLIEQAPKASIEAAAENTAINVPAIINLRRLFKRRSDLLTLTVNDLLVLYRAMHACSYQPARPLLQALTHLQANGRSRAAAEAALQALSNPEGIVPAILIPIDASQQNPAERIYPLSFEVPLAELDLLALAQRTIEALNTAEAHPSADPASSTFDELQRAYLAALAGFGQVMQHAKDIAGRGESASVGTIKLLAHLPTPLQHLLDKIPGKFDVLNDIIKGREVFSNIGVVAPNSTLTRFTSARDDNEHKTLVWGIMTTDRGRMHLSLRDFRPHVAQLAAIERLDLADKIAQDYLDAYANGFNRFIADLHRITLASRQTRLHRA